MMGRNYRADRFSNSGPDGIPGTADEFSCLTRPLRIGDSMPSCSGDFESTGLPGSGTSMPAEAETTSVSISEPELFQRSQEIPIPSGLTGTGSLLCSYGSSPNFRAFDCNIITITIRTAFRDSKAGMPIRSGWGQSSCWELTQHISIKNRKEIVYAKFPLDHFKAPCTAASSFFVDIHYLPCPCPGNLKAPPGLCHRSGSGEPCTGNRG